VLVNNPAFVFAKLIKEQIKKAEETTMVSLCVPVKLLLR
jgi:hypothetical protein